METGLHINDKRICNSASWNLVCAAITEPVCDCLAWKLLCVTIRNGSAIAVATYGNWSAQLLGNRRAMSVGGTGLHAKGTIDTRIKPIRSRLDMDVQLGLYGGSIGLLQLLGKMDNDQPSINEK